MSAAIFPRIPPVDLSIRAEWSGGESPDLWIHAPWLAGLPMDRRDLLALLPVLDLNALGMAGFGAGPAAGAETAIAAVFCADPFLRVRDAAAALIAAGIRRVTNFPTVQVIDGSAARGFDSAGLGAGREAEVLADFAAHGLAVVGFAASAAHGALLARQGATEIVLHPGIAAADWRRRAAAGAAAAQSLRSLRHLTDVPLRLMCPDGYGSELDAARTLADGLVRYGDA